jgi:hypothetical protein
MDAEVQLESGRTTLPGPLSTHCGHSAQRPLPTQSGRSARGLTEPQRSLLLKSSMSGSGPQAAHWSPFPASLGASALSTEKHNQIIVAFHRL